jgi:proline dehydrogenase
MHDCISPIHPSKQATDNSYHNALDYLLSEVHKGHVNLVVATHNRESVQQAVIKMKELDLSPNDGSVTFGQQLGMGDHLTYPLARAGYIVNKVLAYGSMDNIIPFLTRRAQENRGFIHNAQEERLYYIDEIKRRLLG